MRILCPRCLGIVHLLHVDTGMGNGSHNTELDALFVSGLSTEECGAVVIAERTAQTIADFVAKGRHTLNLADVGLHGGSALGQLWGLCSPPFAIDEHVGVDGSGCGTDGAHGFDVVDTHKVEAETIDMVFLHPVFYTFHHILPHDGTFRGRFVAASRGISP